MHDDIAATYYPAFRLISLIGLVRIDEAARFRLEAPAYCY